MSPFRQPQRPLKWVNDNGLGVAPEANCVREENVTDAPVRAHKLGPYWVRLRMKMHRPSFQSFLAVLTILASHISAILTDPSVILKYDFESDIEKLNKCQPRTVSTSLQHKQASNGQLHYAAAQFQT